MSHMDVDAGAGDLQTLDLNTRPVSTGVFKHDRHGRSRGVGDWTTIPKATREPTYKGPGVSGERGADKVGHM